MLAILPSDNEKKISPDKIKKYLSDNNSAYLLLTCSKPSKEGYMEVEMQHDGEEALLLYLLDQVRERLDTDEKEEKTHS